MAAALGLAVTLARTPPPVRSGFVAGATHAGGRFAERGLAPVDPVRLLVEWRPDALVVTAILAVTGFGVARAVRRRAVRSVPWFLAAMAVLLWTLVGGPQAYGTGLLSAHAAQLVLCVVAVPGLLGRAGALPPVPGWLADPVIGAALLGFLLAGVYATPVLELSQTNDAVRLAVDVLALGVGVVCSGRLVALVLAGFGTGALVSPPYADDRLRSLAWDWADAVTDQAATGLILLGVAAAVLVAGTRAATARS
jgi:hypothetical protein